MKDYLYKFCKSQLILDKFQFNVTVSKISKNHTTGSWSVETIRPDAGTTTVSTESFAFVVICTGLFSNAPNIIDIPGSKEFVQAGGKILHSSQWNDMEEFRRQNIIIIGNGKSAADVAVAASKMAKIYIDSSSSSIASTVLEKVIHPPIQCIRKLSWYIPRCVMRFKFLFHSRFVGLLFPPYYEEATLMMRVIHFVCHPIKYLLWRILEIVFIFILRLPYKLWPMLGTMETVNALSVPIVVTDERHLYPIRSGEIDLRVTQVERLSLEKKAHLSDGTIVPVDIVIMGTGWKLDYSFFDKESVLSHMDVQMDGLWLYRNILPPALPGIAFVGANTETSINIFTSYIQAHWLVNLITGNRTAVTIEEMIECTERDKAFKRQYYPSSCMRAASIMVYMQQYHDVLLKEQGIDPYVYTGVLGPLRNLFCPVLPETMTSRFDMNPAKQCMKKSE